MTGSSSSDAPRLIDWTGERCVPWAPDTQVVYEHFHRYLWAASIVAGRRVLDLGSGEGFGAELLARRATSVTGVDIDATTVEHARLHHGDGDRVRFEVGSALDLSAFPDGAFDAVVAFEIIEHVSAHEQVLDEVLRVLAPEGILIISTPERTLYSETFQRSNPFHERELDEAEFRVLLGDRFPHVRVWGQRAITGSLLVDRADADPRTGQVVHIARDGDLWDTADAPPALYLVAVAARGTMPDVADVSTLGDPELALLRDRERECNAVLRAEQRRLEGELDQLASEVARADERAEDAERRAVDAERRAVDAERRAVDAERRAVDAERQVVAAAGDIEAVRADQRAAVELAEQRIQMVEHRLRTLARIEGSITWRAIQRVRNRVFGVLGGERSRGARAIQASLRGLWRLGRSRDVAREPAPPAEPEPGPPLPAPITFPMIEHPTVSIVVAAYRDTTALERTLRSVLNHTRDVGYEVIVVDDAADGSNDRLLGVVERARIERNAENLGYLRSVNAGVALARGQYVVLLNDDVELTDGWLTALVARAERSADISAVAPMLVYPDGTLQEAGAIVFRDGSAWNYGRGHHPDAPEFAFSRDIDYGSAACLLVRRTAWEAVGGFDERYLPMYYEDTDLCLALRDAGGRVVYEPRARIVHHEGTSAGTDTTSGAKRHQELNQPKFREKWAGRLDREHLERDDRNVRRASRRGPGPYVLVIDHAIPCPDQDSGSLRMRNLLEALTGLGARVVFLPDDGQPHQPYTRDLQDLGIEVLLGPVHVDAHVADLAPDLALVILSRPYVASRYLHSVRRQAPHVPVVYDTVDLHYLREERQGELGDPGAAAVAQSMREIELALVRGTDITATVTEEEAEELRGAVPDARVVVLPNVHPAVPSTPGPADRDGLLFVGGFRHPPNADAVRFLVEEVMPLVWREQPDVDLTIVGPDADERVQALASERVHLAGWVQDLDPVLDRARVTVAPLRYGAGMKGKVTQSLAHGLPVVTTAVGAEGLGLQDGRDARIGETPQELAAAILELLRDDELWSRLAAAGRAVVERHCSPDVVTGRLGELLAEAGQSVGA